MAEPTAYDLQQDAERAELQKLIRAEFDPPSGDQYSYPVANQGITQDQWQQMNLTVGDGVVITDGSEFPFELVGHDSDSETNQRNTLILKVSRNTKRNEASLAGFYFRQTEDIELSFPAVTSTTTYRVTITYDPRNFKTNPLRIEVWAGDPPRTQGQQHILLKTVVRKPNQLLSQAEITTHRPHVAPTIVATNEDRLPDAKDVLYGTLGVTRNRTAYGSAIQGTGSIYESRGIHGWFNLLVGDEVKTTAVAASSSSVTAQHVVGGMFLSGRINVNAKQGDVLVRLPTTHSVSTAWRDTVYTTRGAAGINCSGRDVTLLIQDVAGWVDVNTFIPESYL